MSPKFQVATFLAPPSDMFEPTAFPDPGQLAEFKDQTLRQVAHVSVGGDAVKIKFSNLYGSTPLTLDKVRVARSLGGGRIDVTTDRAVTFNGTASVTIAPGLETYSDEIPFALAPLSDVGVSIYMKRAIARTGHRAATTTTYIADGDWVSAVEFQSTVKNTTTYFMPSIDVVRSTKVPVIVAFGDSITAGLGSTIDANKSWPDQLAAMANSANAISIVNAGVGGNRWVKSNPGPCGLCRFERDVLNVSGVTHVIMFLGVNDIGLGYYYANTFKDPSWIVNTNQITESLQLAITQAKAKGLKVYVSPIAQFKGSFYYTSGQSNEVPFGWTSPYDGESIRQAVNEFVRLNRLIDGVIDFPQSIQNPTDSLQQRPEWNSGDNLHPNDIGYSVMAEAALREIFR